MFCEVKGLSKSYNNKKVLDNVDFKVNQGELVSLIGPSGAGKSTLLKIIASMEEPDRGGVHFAHPPSKRQPVILVFQDYILFPHMTVFENVAFGLRSRKEDKKKIDEKVSSILEYFGIGDKARSFPAQLSGGQKQRAAIARALVISPAVLLLDEPFANLDKNLKQETAEFIRETQRKFAITIIEVTHDQSEAFSISDKIGILLEGRLEQFGPPGELYFNPASFEVACFLGPVNHLPRGLLSSLNIPEPGEEKDVWARAEGIEIAKEPQGRGIIKEIVFTGIMILYKIDLEGTLLKVYSLTNHLKKGDRVSLKIENWFLK